MLTALHAYKHNRHIYKSQNRTYIHTWPLLKKTSSYTYTLTTLHAYIHNMHIDTYVHTHAHTKNIQIYIHTHTWLFVSTGSSHPRCCCCTVVKKFAVIFPPVFDEFPAAFCVARNCAVLCELELCTCVLLYVCEYTLNIAHFSHVCVYFCLSLYAYVCMYMYMQGSHVYMHV